MIVDDHALFRRGVRAELESLARRTVSVVGEAGSVDEAVAVIGHRRPDVVLLDVHMPDGGGAAVLARTRPEHPEVVFLALSVSDAAEDVISVIRAGARGYVTKTISGRELADAVVRVHAGDAVFSPRLAGFVLDAFADRPGAHRRRRPRARPAHPPRARRPAPARPRLVVQGDRRRARHLGEDRRDPRVERAAQDPVVEPPRALALGERPPARLRSRSAVVAVVAPPSAAARRCRRRARRPPSPPVIAAWPRSSPRSSPPWSSARVARGCGAAVGPAASATGPRGSARWRPRGGWPRRHGRRRR